MRKLYKALIAIPAIAVLGLVGYYTATEPVTDENYSLAFSDLIAKDIADKGGDNKFYHHRTLVPLDDQPVPTINRDTMYSYAAIDATSDFTITIPELDGRYASLQVLNQGHFDAGVYLGAGTHTIQASNTTDWVAVNVRIQVDGTDPADIAYVNTLQDKLQLDFFDVPRKPFETANWNMLQFIQKHKYWIAEANERGVLNTFAKVGEIDDDHRNRGTAIATGLLPADQAIYSVALMKLT